LRNWFVVDSFLYQIISSGKVLRSCPFECQFHLDNFTLEPFHINTF